MNSEPGLNIKYSVEGSDGNWMAMNRTVRDVARIADRINYISYHSGKMEYSFSDIKEPRKLIEEMIHDCLPAPYEIIGVDFRMNNQEYKWKEYLLEFLLEGCK